MDAVLAVAVLALVVVVIHVATRQNEIFRIDVRGGRATVARGKVPPAFLADVRAIVRHVDRGTVRAIRHDGAPRIVVAGAIDDRTAQRLRNAFALLPMAKA